jgi:hypothetical protein
MLLFSRKIYKYISTQTCLLTLLYKNILKYNKPANVSLLPIRFTSSHIKIFILTRPAFFPIEHRRTESVCYYAIKSLSDVLYLDM